MPTPRQDIGFNERSGICEFQGLLAAAARDDRVYCSCLEDVLSAPLRTSAAFRLDAFSLRDVKQSSRVDRSAHPDPLCGSAGMNRPFAPMRDPIGTSEARLAPISYVSEDTV